MAVNALAAAGSVNVYNIVNGLEGDRVDDPGSVYHGKHMRNGWKNSGLPWGYGFHPDHVGRPGSFELVRADLSQPPAGTSLQRCPCHWFIVAPTVLDS